MVFRWCINLVQKKPGCLNIILSNVLASSIHASVLLEWYRLLQLQNGLRYFLRDLSFWRRRFIKHPNIRTPDSSPGTYWQENIFFELIHTWFLPCFRQNHTCRSGTYILLNFEAGFHSFLVRHTQSRAGPGAAIPQGPEDPGPFWSGVRPQVSDPDHHCGHNRTCLQLELATEARGADTVPDEGWVDHHYKNY